MTDPVNLNASIEKDPRAKARRAWGDFPPDWISALADEAWRTSQAAVADRLKISDSQVSQLLSRSYKGDVAKAELKVRGALLGEIVECPELGEIPRDQCLWEQAQPPSSASTLRNEIWRACRSGCPHSRIKGASDGE